MWWERGGEGEQDGQGQKDPWMSLTVCLSYMQMVLSPHWPSSRYTSCSRLTPKNTLLVQLFDHARNAYMLSRETMTDELMEAVVSS
jgi:hypothetical protein